jgi:serine/threonine protein kinase
VNPSEEPFRVREIWPPGTLIKGDFSIQRKLGGGGFGTVYLAHHRFFNTTHVIKRLHEQYASDAEYVRKFVNEARAVRRLKGCPNVVEVEHMTQSEDGHLILVMEHITGGDLAGLMASRQLTVDEVINYARQIASGLEAAHAANLIHRDIKPENVMISHNSTGKVVLKLIDFGIAADHLSQQQTSVMRGGSIGYAAPEQWVKAGKELDGRTDLYSLGASMYRMLCGRMPYEADDIGDWIEKVKQGPPIAPSRLRQDVPKPLSDLILEMLALRAEGRPADAATVIRRLDGIRGGAAPTIDDVQINTIFLLEPPASRRPVWAIAGAIAAVALVGAWLAVGNREPSAVPVKPQTAPVVTQDPKPPPVTQKKPPPSQKEARPEPLTAKTRAAEPKTPHPVQQQVPQPAVDHAALGDAALNAGDYRAALGHYKVVGDPKRLADLQRGVESDSDERAMPLLDKGQYSDALRLVDNWILEFPNSQRLQTLRARIVRAKDAQ